MTVYTARFLDKEAIVRREYGLSCSNDEEAIQRLSILAHHYMLELWEGGRIVWRFDPNARHAEVQRPVGTRFRSTRRPRTPTRAMKRAVNGQVTATVN